jgi:hypothetical protein
MAIPWLTVLKAVPWAEVIGNAPRLAGAGRRLWESVGRKAPTTGDAGKAAAPPDSDAIASGLARQGAEIAALKRQMAESSELVAALADQNAQLVACIDAHRRQLRRVMLALLVLALLAALALFRSFSG